MKKTNLFLINLFLLLFSGCGPSISGDLYLKNSPILKMEEFFNGNVEAWGIIQDRKGNMTRSFKVSMKGDFSGGAGKIYEEFLFSDGEAKTRTWVVNKNSEGSYQGKADDILEGASGKTYGNSLNWEYEMDLEVDGSTYRVRFDDWMWQIDNKVIFNRSYIKKFGIVVGELSLFMKKLN